MWVLVARNVLMSLHSSLWIICTPLPPDYFSAFHLLQDRWQLDWSSSRYSANKLPAVKPSIAPWSSPFHRIWQWETTACFGSFTYWSHPSYSWFLHGVWFTLGLPTLVLVLRSHILLVCPHFAVPRLRYFPFLSGFPPPLPCISQLSLGGIQVL